MYTSYTLFPDTTLFRSHVAFTAPSRDVVDAFHKAVLAAGGRDNGKPGLRPHYHPNYYGAFVLDPDGHNIEVVCHLPGRSEEHTSELQSLMRTSYAVFCLKNKNTHLTHLQANTIDT